MLNPKVDYKSPKIGFFCSSVLELPVFQEQRSERRRRSGDASEASQLAQYPRCLRSASKGSTPQGEHGCSAGQARAAHPADQHHQPGSQTCCRTAADPHQAGSSVQGEGQRPQREGFPQEDQQCRSGSPTYPKQLPAPRFELTPFSCAASIDVSQLVPIRATGKEGGSLRAKRNSSPQRIQSGMCQF